MRPWSEVRCDLEAALIEGGGTTRQLAMRTGWSVGRTREALNNMARAGDVLKTSRREPGVRRPVPVYSRQVRRDAAAQDDAPMVSLIAAWAGVVATGGQGAGQQ